jgi:hypothetical protein
LAIRWINFVVRIRADLDEPLKELAENFGLFLRQRSENS